MTSLPAGLPALSVLVEEARAPGAARAEVDALLAGLSQPLPSEASPRERADLLLSLIEDGQIADYTGTDGRSVRVAATQALLALGYPYALEVPPEALEAKAREEEDTGPDFLSTRRGQVGFGLVALPGTLLLLPVLYWMAMDSWSEIGRTATVVILVITGTTFLPALLTVIGHNTGSRGLKITGNVWLSLAALFWFFMGFRGFGDFPFSLIPPALGGLILASSIVMSSKD